MALVTGPHARTPPHPQPVGSRPLQPTQRAGSRGRDSAWHQTPLTTVADHPPPRGRPPSTPLPRHAAPTGHAGQGDSVGPPHPHTRAHSTWVADPNSPPSGRAVGGGGAPDLRRPSQQQPGTGESGPDRPPPSTPDRARDQGRTRGGERTTWNSPTSAQSRDRARCERHTDKRGGEATSSAGHAGRDGGNWRHTTPGTGPEPAVSAAHTRTGHCTRQSNSGALRHAPTARLGSLRASPRGSHWRQASSTGPAAPAPRATTH